MLIHVPRRLAVTHWGGTERVLEETLPELISLGIEQNIFTSKALDNTEHSQLAQVPIQRFDYSYCQWPLPKEVKAKYDLCGGNLLSLRLETALLQQKNLNLIHCHTGNRLAAQCLSVAQRRDIPCVITLHGGHFAVPAVERQQKAHKDSQRPFSVNWGKFWSAYYGTRGLLNRASAVICVGIDEYQAAKQALPRQRVHLLPGGVNLESFNSGQPRHGCEILNLPEGTPYLACIARLDHQKDQLTLIKALSRLKHPPHLALIGPETTPGYEAQLKQVAAAGGVGERLIFTGAVAPQEIPHLLAGAQVSVLPSLHEPFGLSVVEAWASGTPLIASRVGGPAWLLEKEQEGLLFSSGSANELADKLERVLTDSALNECLRSAGLVRARQYTWKERARRLMTIYKVAGANFQESKAA